MDPSADVGDVALANLIASMAQNTIISMQNEVVAQNGLFSTNRAILTQQVADWLALP